ncbi:MAG: RNA-splicing ligase RtcB [Caldiserica bacterium]|nr:MAG: RNA-splicing ligase RtcB [Caldisericota bacterium]
MDWKVEKIEEFIYRIPKEGKMRVEGRLYISEKMISHLKKDNTPLQVVNVAHLPGIVKYSLAMPDMHWGYGFCIGGVAAMDINKNGVISPGGIGYDINCGVRLIRTNLTFDDVKERIENIMSALFVNIPSGVGSTGKLRLSEREMRDVLIKGSEWAIEKGYGFKEDILSTEDGGRLKWASPDYISPRAYERGRGQLGTLGSGNHFLEVQKVVNIYDEELAKKWGVFLNQIVIMIHSGSRGFGHQVCDDYIKVMQKAVKRYGIYLPDRQLACAPFNSEEGKRYFQSMCAAANYAWCNRQIMMHWVRESFTKVLGISPRDFGGELIYDVAHNIGKIEEYDGRKYIVHRKGATRALPQGNPLLPEKYRETGQPVIIPGSMGTESYLLVGTEKAKDTFYSTCHGAGREMSRHEALRRVEGYELRRRLEGKGIVVESKSIRGLAEEAPEAYKDVSEVVRVVVGAGISKKVARMIPVGVVKG